MTGKEIVDSIDDTKRMNNIDREKLIEKIDYELKKIERLAEDRGANLTAIGFL